jgi:hypothetical protein
MVDNSPLMAVGVHRLSPLRLRVWGVSRGPLHLSGRDWTVQCCLQGVGGPWARGKSTNSPIRRRILAPSAGAREATRSLTDWRRFHVLSGGRDSVKARWGRYGRGSGGAGSDPVLPKSHIHSWPSTFPGQIIKISRTGDSPMPDPMSAGGSHLRLSASRNASLSLARLAYSRQSSSSHMKIAHHWDFRLSFCMTAKSVIGKPFPRPRTISLAIPQ